MFIQGFRKKTQPALATAAAAAVEDEVDYIYGNVVDVSPLRR
jgi:hypothetical protein